MHIDKNGKEYSLNIYKEQILTIISNPDSNKINSYFLNDDTFDFTINNRTLNVTRIKSKFNVLYCSYIIS